MRRGPWEGDGATACAVCSGPGTRQESPVLTGLGARCLWVCSLLDPLGESFREKMLLPGDQILPGFVSLLRVFIL